MTWQTYRTDIAVNNGTKPALVMLDTRFGTEARPVSLSRLVWVGVWNALPPDGHLWNPEETEALEQVERALLAAAEDLAHGWAIYVMCICTPGMHEYYFYAGEHAEFDQLSERVRAACPSYRIEQDEQHDPSWEMYYRYQRSLKNPLSPPN